MKRLSNVIKVGNCFVGGNYPILIQSMCNIKTSHTKEVINQINSLEKAGCQIIRVSVLDLDDAYAIREIKKHINIPIVADIHFDYKLALTSIESGADKLRINPGNIGKLSNIKEVVEKCKEKNIPIRIGVNSGSLEKDLLDKYGQTATTLVESALRHVKILEDLDFHDIVISCKASDVLTTVEAYRLLHKKVNYPLHIGITEAGSKDRGTIKSSIGLGILLNEGIGDTIRVSLSADPIEEIKVAKEILATFNYCKKIDLISCPTCGRTEYNMLELLESIEKFVEALPQVDLKIAVMGCIVNGPGEAKNADIGIAGGKNSCMLFKKGEIIRKIEEKDIYDEFTKEIENLVKEKLNEQS